MHTTTVVSYSKGENGKTTDQVQVLRGRVKTTTGAKKLNKVNETKTTNERSRSKQTHTTDYF